MVSEAVPSMHDSRTKQLVKISPWLPIGVLSLTSLQAATIIHGYAYDRGLLPSLASSCHVNSGHFFAPRGSAFIEAMDRLVCTLVQFFKTGIEDPVTYLILLEFAGLVATLTLIGLISANRSSAGIIVRFGTTAFLMLGQVVTFAVMLPLYFSLIIWKSSYAARASFMPSGSARAMMPALVVGFVIPTALILYPSLFGTERDYETATAIWQVFPIMVSIVAISLGLCFKGLNGSMTTSDAMLSTTFIVGSMDMIGLFSFLIHAIVMFQAYDQGHTILSFVPAFRPSSTTEMVQSIFTYDLLTCMVAVWTLIFYDTTRFAGVGRTSVFSAILLSVFGTVLIGPGGATAWAWSNIEKARLGALVQDRPPKEKRLTS